jgi:hypothetical protein
VRIPLLLVVGAALLAAAGGCDAGPPTVDDIEYTGFDPEMVRLADMGYETYGERPLEEYVGESQSADMLRVVCFSMPRMRFQVATLVCREGQGVLTWKVGSYRETQDDGRFPFEQETRVVEEATCDEMFRCVANDRLDGILNSPWNASDADPWVFEVSAPRGARRHMVFAPHESIRQTLTCLEEAEGGGLLAFEYQRGWP